SVIRVKFTSALIGAGGRRARTPGGTGLPRDARRRAADAAPAGGPDLGPGLTLVVRGTGMTTPKKLIEVALPLEAINTEGSRRKRKAPAGYPTTLHKWWAQRPLAAARAVIFAQMVDAPSSHPDLFPTEEAQEK